MGCNARGRSIYVSTLYIYLFCHFRENNSISIYNDGHGIPIEMHKEQKVFVPTLIFGHLLTSSNYDDEEKKVTGGRNGYGAKLCNIFSTKFTVETACSENGKKFKQVSHEAYNTHAETSTLIKDLRSLSRVSLEVWLLVESTCIGP